MMKSFGSEQADEISTAIGEKDRQGSEVADFLMRLEI
jgi:hypothetical protein